MIEPGRSGAYLALFGEMGFALLVATLVGALGGHWLDGRGWGRGRCTSS